MLRCQSYVARLYIALFPWISIFQASVTQPPAQAAQTPSTNILSVAVNSVKWQPEHGSDWREGREHDHLSAGGTLQTGSRSRAEVALVSGIIVKMGSQSDYQVPPVRDSQFKRGIFHIFSRTPLGNHILGLPGAIATIRGTDFFLRVKDDGDIALGVLDGGVVLSNSLGSVTLTNGDVGFISRSRTPTKARLNALAEMSIQWSFYYPGILNIDELPFPPQDSATKSSRDLYRAGDLNGAVAAYPWDNPGRSDSHLLFKSTLLLAVGQVDEARRELAELNDDLPQKRALLVVIAAVCGEILPSGPGPVSSSEWLAMSYFRQMRGDLEGARAAASTAVSLAPRFGFAYARRAELEFSFGERHAARRSVDQALALCPRNAHAIALRGFLDAARGDVDEAIIQFNQAIESDNAYANAWLGRGLCFIRKGQVSEGQRDLFIAATLEPQRAVYRSYLGKSFHELGDILHARRELELAKLLDPYDPTSYLYSAMLHQQQNQPNMAVEDLEAAQIRGDNRRIFRSRLLLDEDRSVRGANLAAIYREAGLQEVSLSEAADSVANDYSNFSAHLFMANSFNSFRDSRFAETRFEAAAFSEYLLANLLSPIGGAPLSQQVSQQEYSRFFDRNRLGFASETSLLANGQWQQSASQFGVWDDYAYALDSSYRQIPGDAPGVFFEQEAASLQMKQQVAEDDSLYFQTVYNHLDFGDVARYYDPAQASATLRNHEVQDPNLFAGWHHQWGPGSHTLILLSHLRDDFTSEQPNARIHGLLTDNAGRVTNTMAGLFGPGAGERFRLRIRSEFELYSGEVQQIWRSPLQTLISGVRMQSGSVDSRASARFEGDFFASFRYPQGEFPSSGKGAFSRASGYTYHILALDPSLSVISGVALDRVEFPSNAVIPPFNDDLSVESLVSPKLGFVWTADDSSRVRAAYSRSLGGLFFDASVRLEPVQLAGFTQAFRSLAPESVAGLAPGTVFETWNVAADHRIGPSTYFGWQAALAESAGSRAVGVFSGPSGFAELNASQATQTINFQERAFNIYANHLLAREWSVGFSYRVSDSEFALRSRGIPASAWPEGTSLRGARLQNAQFKVIHNHRSGWFASFETLWTHQQNKFNDRNRANDDFWQINLFTGYRFPMRRAELTVGLLNITGQDYRLNPVSLYADLPREATVYMNLRLNL